MTTLHPTQTLGSKAQVLTTVDGSRLGLDVVTALTWGEDTRQIFAHFYDGSKLRVTLPGSDATLVEIVRSIELFGSYDAREEAVEA